MDAKTENFRTKTLEKLSPKVKPLYLKKEAEYLNDGGTITVGKIIGLVVVCIVIAYVLPTALVALGAINTSGMTDGEVALLGSIGIIIVLVIFAAIAKEAE
jgi:hypothetical protein